MSHPGARHRPRRGAAASSCSPPTAPASCTTRSSGAAFTTGWSTPASSGRSPSCGARLPEATERLARQVAVAAAAAARRGPAQAAGSGREPRLGARAAGARGPRAGPGGRGGHAGRRAEVPGGLRTGSGPVGRWDCGGRARRCLSRLTPARRRGAGWSVRPGAARRRSRCRRRTASRPSPRRSDGSTRRGARTSTGPAGPRCAPSPDDLPRYDAAFDACFGGASRPAAAARPPQHAQPAALAPPPLTDGAVARRPGGSRAAHASASPVEVLRHRDFAELTAGRARRAGAGSSPRSRSPAPRRPSRRHQPARAGPDRPGADGARDAGAGGEPARLARRSALPATAPGGAAGRRQRVDAALRRCAAALRACRRRAQPGTRRRSRSSPWAPG